MQRISVLTQIMIDWFKRRFQQENNYETFDDEQSSNRKWKTRLELIRLSAIVCGIEFCYAAETAFVSPILLQIGLPVIFMTLTWCLPPLIGFFLVPALGSLSDGCQTRFGRRRPFILLYSIGILSGLLLVANGRIIGQWMGDSAVIVSNNQTVSTRENHVNTVFTKKYGMTLTILGVLLLDLDCDACQSPSRAYLLDVTHPEQHAQGLTMFTFMAGFGGCLGYFLGGIPWERTFLSELLGDHIHVLFTLVWFIYVVCLISTLTAAKEPNSSRTSESLITRSLSRQGIVSSESGILNVSNSSEENYSAHTKISYADYMRSIIYMPSALRWLCLTNFFCWMALVSYSLYFTDFVGQAVFGGNPNLEFDHPLRILYNDGVRFGSWGMSMYSISCSIYSYNIQKLNDYFGIKRVYIGSQLIYAVGMLLMGLFRHRLAVIVLSAVAGILYSTLFTIPYLLISKYHSMNVFEQSNFSSNDGQIRGIGTDVAVVSSMVFLAQLCLSSSMGTLVQFAGSTVIITIVASCLSICGALSATKVLYIP